MAQTLIAKLFGSLTFKEVLFLVLMVAIFWFTWNTNTIIVGMDERYYSDIEEGASAVLSTLQQKGILTPNDIAEFLAPKPAGRTSLKKGVTCEKVYQRLVETYGDLARNARMIFQ